MKYMGSKSAMLKNGLGELLIEQSSTAKRFIDLFSGSATVSWYVAERQEIPVISCDLQTYSYFLAKAVIGRTCSLSKSQIDQANEWIAAGKKYYNDRQLVNGYAYTQKFVIDNRRTSSQSHFLLVRAYGGYYYSNSQITTFNYLLSTLPEDIGLKDVLMACLIEAASYCAASPGHTAQPFNPSGNGLDALHEAWERNPIEIIEAKFKIIKDKHAKVMGKAFVQDAKLFLPNIAEGDLVFVDPPYSSVHYSRFYHVLESLARMKIGSVSGVGRYPEPSERPQSDYSLRGKSNAALDNLLSGIAKKKAKAMITFPHGTSSNGLSGNTVKDIATKHFKVSKELIKGRFSTLGGNNTNRPARQESEELILMLEPK